MVWGARGEVGWTEKTLEGEKLCEWMRRVRENAVRSRCVGGEGCGGKDETEGTLVEGGEKGWGGVRERKMGR
jgi:hypothetical protein